MLRSFVYVCSIVLTASGCAPEGSTPYSSGLWLIAAASDELYVLGAVEHPDGGVCAVGSIASPEDPSRYGFFTCIRDDGTQWVAHTLASAGPDQVNGIVIEDDGTMHVAGFVSDGATTPFGQWDGAEKIGFVATFTREGAPLRSATWRDATLNDIALDGERGIVAVGSSTARRGGLVIRLGPDGTQASLTVLHEGTDALLGDVALMPDGRAIVGGFVPRADDRYPGTGVIAALAIDGTLLWRATESRGNEPVRVCVTADGRVLVGITRVGGYFGPVIDILELYQDDGSERSVEGGGRGQMRGLAAGPSGEAIFLMRNEDHFTELRTTGYPSTNLSFRASISAGASSVSLTSSGAVLVTGQFTGHALSWPMGGEDVSSGTGKLGFVSRIEL